MAGNYPHTDWLDLYNDGTLHECAIVKKDALGNVYFIRLRELDMVDKRRIAKILTGRNALNFALWDLLFQQTLGNGMNALEYFHQYVKVKTPAGRIMLPTIGAIGASQGIIKVNDQNQQAPKGKPLRTPPPA